MGMSLDENRTTPSGIESPPLSVVGRTPAWYLFAISRLSRDGQERVTTGDLRSALDVAAATVTEMVSKLAERRLADYEPYRGVTLTEAGAAVAARVAWRVCTVENFFASVLDADLDDRTAFEIGWTLSAEGLRRMQEMGHAPCLELCPESGPTYDQCPA